MTTLGCGNATNSATKYHINPSALLQSWAAATTEVWMKEVQVEMRRKKRIETSLRFRARKKQELTQLRSERDRLEDEAKRCLGALKITDGERDNSTALTIPGNIVDAVRRLAFEGDALRSDNLRLQQTLQNYDRFVSLSGESMEMLSPVVKQSSTSLSVREASRASLWVTTVHVGREPGWFVHFPNGEPSFYFHPFTQAAFDSKFKVCDELLASKLPCSSIVGKMFGWTVRHAPLVSRPEDNSMLAHARFTMRVGVALDDADAFMTATPTDAVAVLFVSPDGSRAQRDLVSMQVLQEFDHNGFVMVCNIPIQGGHTRYFQHPRRSPRTESDGRRSISYQIVIADSETNARCRIVESDARWIGEGGVSMKFTEVDETTIDVSADYWGICESEAHAQHYFILWTEYACQWSQGVVPLLGTK